MADPSLTQRKPSYPLDPEIGATRGAIDRAVLGAIRSGLQHWLFVVNVGMGIFSLLPFLAPYLLAQGYDRAASAIYAFYSLTCHQMPSRSFFLWGEQMAYCQRNTAIYLAMFLAGLAYVRVRDRLRPLSLRWYALLILPIALDGFTQLFGLRESTWELRLLTGALFGVASIWLTFPYIERNAREVEAELVTLGARDEVLGVRD